MKVKGTITQSFVTGEITQLKVKGSITYLSVAGDISLSDGVSHENDFITEWTVPGGAFTLPMYNILEYNCTINWGDGSPLSTITAWNDTDATHIYAAGTYQISINGTFESLYINNGAVKTYLNKVIQWGDVGFKSFGNAFYGCSNLTDLPTGSITGIDNLVLGSFTRAFQNSGITSIPSGFFDNCTGLTSFAHCFAGCPITSIPSGLFNYNTLILFFDYCFNGCPITSIPVNLFINNISVLSYTHCFEDCTSLIGDAPELWNLIPEPAGTDCFSNDTSLDNWDDIPEDWGGDVDYCTEYLAVYNAMTNKPSDADAIIQNAKMLAIVAGGRYAKSERHFEFSAHSNSAGESQLDWIDPVNHLPVTNVNGCAWDAYNGFIGATVGSKYLRSNFIPSVDGTLIGQNNISAIIGVGNDLAGNNLDFGMYAGIRFHIVARQAANTARYRCNSALNADIANLNSIKYYAMSRNNAANFDNYINLVKTNSVVVSTGLANLELYICAGNVNGVPQINNHQLRFATIGSYHTEAEVTTAMTDEETYLTNYGTNLIP